MVAPGRPIRVPAFAVVPHEPLHTFHPLWPVRRYPHLRISVRGPGPSGTSTHLTRQLPGTHDELSGSDWLGGFAYSAGASARAERQVRDELAQSKAAQDQLLAERSQQQLAAGDLAQIQATLAAARGELETLAQR